MVVHKKETLIHTLLIFSSHTVHKQKKATITTMHEKGLVSRDKIVQLISMERAFHDCSKNNRMNTEVIIATIHEKK